MDGFRKLMRGWLGKTLLALIILPFAFVGIEGFFSGGGRDKPVLEVNGHEIGKAEVEQAIQNRKQQLLQRMGEGVDPSMISDDMIRPGTIDALVQRQLVIQAAKDEGVHVPAEAVKAYVRSLQQFHDENGEFSQALLERFLAQSGMTTQRVFDEVRTDMLTEQLQAGITESAFAIPGEVERIVALDRQLRDIATLRIKPETFKASLTVSDEELQAFFDKNADEWRTDERVQVEYLQFTVADFTDPTEAVTQDQIAQKREELMQEARKNERRRAAHILFEAGEKHSDEEAKALAESVLKELSEGANFAALAKAKSDDTESAKNGGDLGFAGREVYDPAFEEALFALAKEGDLSSVVKTEFGYHVIKLLGVETPKLPASVDNDEYLAGEIRKLQAQEKMALAVDDLNRLAFESGDLSVIAEQYKKQVSVSDWLTRRVATGVFANANVLDVAFSDAVVQEQRNSDVVELNDGSLLMMRLKSHEAPRQQTLDEVRDQVREAALAEKAQEKARSVAEELVAKLREGSNAEALASAQSLTWEKNAAVARTSSAIARPIVQRAFELPKPTVGESSFGTLPLGGGEMLVVAVSNVTEKSDEKSADQQDQFAKGLAYRSGNVEIEGYLETLESAAEIVRFEDQKP